MNPDQNSYQLIGGFMKITKRTSFGLILLLILWFSFAGLATAEFEENIYYQGIKGDKRVERDSQFDYIDETDKATAEPRINIDRSFKTIEPQFDATWCYSEGLALIEKDGKYGYIDPTGKIIIKPQFELAYNFLEGFALVKKGGKWGCIDKTGRITFKPQFDDDYDAYDKKTSAGDLETGKIKEKEVISCVNFDFDSDKIKPEAYPILDKIADKLKEDSSMRAVVEGHCDYMGSEEYNLDLSERRAKSISQYLVQKGIVEAKLSSFGYGKSRPIESNETESGREKNRRVEVLFIETK